ncbi:MAG: hypothetical protein LBL26_02500 [Peptococcaceae bacterium]|nr:hypothetical protein [Peptococcaceae bacterium]
MIFILDWIFEGIATWIASVVTGVMDAMAAIFLDALGTDMTAMEEYFPFVAKAFVIMQYTAWALLFIFTVWQLFRVFGGPITEAENPWHLLARSTIFSVLIGYARPIFDLVLDIARAPYTALMAASMDPGDFTFAGIENVVSSSMVTLVSAVSIVGLLLQIILMIALGWNYFKLLLEVVERYVVVGVLCYTSPLAFCMGGSKATVKVFQSWCRMIGSQLLLLVMNVWFLRAFNSSVGQFTANGGALTSGRGNAFLWLFCALAFLKTAQKFDGYLASLGLSVAQTGSGMGMELLMGMRVLSGFAGDGFRNAGNMVKGASGSGMASGAGNAAGMASAGGFGFMTGLVSKFKGNSYVRDAVVDGGARMGAGGGIGFVGRAFGGMAARNGAELSGNSIASVAARPASVSGIIAGDIADRSIKNYMPHLAGKSEITDATVGNFNDRPASGIVRDQTAFENMNQYGAQRFDEPVHSTTAAADHEIGSETIPDGMAFSDIKHSDAQMVSEHAETPMTSEIESMPVTAQSSDALIHPATTSAGSAKAIPDSISFADADAQAAVEPRHPVTPDDNAASDAMPNEASFAANPYGNTQIMGEAVRPAAQYGGSLLGAAPGETPFAADQNSGDQTTGETVRSAANDGGSFSSAVPTGTSLADVQYSGTQITGGHISTTATTTDGKTASIDLYSASQFEKPESPHSVVSASDGSQWYQIASGDAMDAFYPTPQFSGDASEATQAAAAFPTVPEGASLRTVDDGVFETGNADGGNSLWYSSAFYQEPEAPHDSIQSSDGVTWYAMRPHAETPHFESHTSVSDSDIGGETAHSDISAPNIDSDGADSGGFSEAAMDYNRAQFQQFMPGFTQPASQIDASRHSDGIVEARHADGSATAFYDKTMYQSPRGDYQVYEDDRGGQWYAVHGMPTVERRPVYEGGKPVYDGENVKTVNVESVRYKTAPIRFETPKKRDVNDRKPPKPKKK